jgi:hypothetical protein
MRPLPFALLLLASAASAEEPAAGSTLKVGVVPFAALSGEVPQRAGPKAAAMLSNELKNTEGVQVVEPKRAPAAEPFKEGLARAKEWVEQAQSQRNQHKFRLAEESLGKALESYRAAAAGLTEMAELQDAYTLLSAVQYNTGRDEEGQRSLATALALAPQRELPLAATSPSFARVVSQARKAVLAAPKGSLLVESSPSAAAVSVDGVPLGGTPLLVKGVPPGLHAWRVQLPSGDAAGGTVEVAAGKSAKVSGQIAGSDPESLLLAELSQNKLSPAGLTAAKEAASGMDAQVLLFGALSREGKNLALDGFALDVPSGDVRRLPRSTFDAELLSAGMELYNLAGEISRQGNKVGDAAKVPGPVAVGHAQGAVQVAQAEYGVQLNKLTADVEGESTPPPTTDGARTPLSKPGSRRPLKK